MKVATLRRDAVQRAFVLEWFTFGWMCLEAAVALASGVIAHSITLTAFGVDSIIELLSAGVLLWRLHIELRRGQELSEHAERAAARVAGALLGALAIYITAIVIWSILHRTGESFSLPGLVVAVAAIPIMYLLSKNKLAIAAEIGSRALRADAVESITCGYLSVVVVVGLLAQLLLHAWWVDAVTSLAIVYFVAKEAREAWSDEGCSCVESALEG